ncbi:DNA-protecting protein DprA, partial [Pseudooceanicola lipolyticus]
RDGAVLVRSAADVIEAIGPAEPPASEQPTLPLDPAQPETRSLQDSARLHAQILGRLGPSPVAEDQLLRDLSLPAGDVAPALVDLELEGRIARHAGGLLSLVN